MSKKIIQYLLLILVCVSFTMTTVAADNPLDGILKTYPAQNNDALVKNSRTLLDLGKEQLDALCDMLKPSREGGDTQVRFAVSGLTKYFQQYPADAAKPMFIKVLLDALDRTESTGIKAYLIRELQFIGGKESVLPISRYLTNERLCEPAAQALFSINTPEAAASLLFALPQVEDSLKQIIIKVAEAVQRNGRMFRLNTWFRFSDNFYGFNTPVKPIKKLVNSGMLGWPLKATINASTGFNWKFNWSGRTDLIPEQVPSELDYQMWLGPAPYKPYHPHRVHGTFRGYWDYDGGGLGDMGQHYLDPVQYLLNKDDTSPIEIEVDTPQQHYDAVGSWRRITMTYADGCQIVLDGEDKDKDAPFLAGPNGKLYKNFRSDIPNIEKKLAAFPDPEPQVTDFTEAVRTRKKFALNESNGHRSCTLINLGKIAVRLGRNLKYDPVKQEFINDEAANRLIYQPMRAPWHL